MAGRPRKEPGTLAHDTRERYFLQVERNEQFDEALEQARVKIAAQRSIILGRKVEPHEVSMGNAVRVAISAYVSENKNGHEVIK